jgi:D-tyrosyl-tRNA(Tyr) deacylase
MRVVVQRVVNARVIVPDKSDIPAGEISKGILVYLGIEHDDTTQDAKYIVDKIVNLRIFNDDSGKMNCSVKDCKGEILVISQFTLLADTRKGRRPSYSNAAKAEQAKPLYEYCIKLLKNQNIPVQTGLFQAFMEVTYTNVGPVTIYIDSHKII